MSLQSYQSDGKDQTYVGDLIQVLETCKELARSLHKTMKALGKELAS